MPRRPPFPIIARFEITALPTSGGGLIARQLGDIRRNPLRFIAHELCGALRYGALRTRSAMS